LLDSHCHLNDAKYQDKICNIIANYLHAGVEKSVCVGWDIPSSIHAQNIAQKYDSVYYSVGVHPDECDSYNQEELENLLVNKTNKLVALGEIGLDYFHNKENKERQIEVFEKQIKLAKKYNLPIIIHCRDAFRDTLEVLKKHAPFKSGAVMHCYSGSLEFANELIKLGIKLSFTGTVTYKNAVNLKEVALNIPLNSFFFETDAPYLSPQSKRGQMNEPANVKEVYEFVANLRGINAEEFEILIDNNVKQFFDLN